MSCDVPHWFSEEAFEEERRDHLRLAKKTRELNDAIVMAGSILRNAEVSASPFSIEELRNQVEVARSAALRNAISADPYGRRGGPFGGSFGLMESLGLK